MSLSKTNLESCDLTEQLSRITALFTHCIHKIESNLRVNNMIFYTDNRKIGDHATESTGTVDVQLELCLAEMELNCYSTSPLTFIANNVIYTMITFLCC